MLATEFEVNAPIEKVWDAWTTPVGIKTGIDLPGSVFAPLYGAFPQGRRTCRACLAGSCPEPGGSAAGQWSPWSAAERPVSLANESV